MVPNELKPEQFSKYTPQARQLATTHIALLRSLPLAFLPLLLRELIAYDWKFPAERRELDQQLIYLGEMTPEALAREMAAFHQLRLSHELSEVDWVVAPAQFSEKLSAHLWATRQMDAFRIASVDYIRKMHGVATTPPLAMSRLSVVLVGQGVGENQHPLFRKLRPYGTYFSNIRPESGKETIFQAVAARAAAQPLPFAHWYVEGGESNGEYPGVTCVSYKSLDKVRQAVLEKMRDMTKTGDGPEALRTSLAQMQPDDLGLGDSGTAAILNRFQLSVLAEGAGTQIFSTTFVQWTAREILRRAQPLTLLARYAPRQQEHSMEQVLAGTKSNSVPDANGALIDADMGAYYTWINQQRLMDSQRASFLVWFEGHNEALAIGPAFNVGHSDARALRMKDLVLSVSNGGV